MSVFHKFDPHAFRRVPVLLNPLIPRKRRSRQRTLAALAALAWSLIRRRSLVRPRGRGRLPRIALPLGRPRRPSGASRTGRRISTSEPALPSSTAVCRGLRPRRAPSPAVSSNGSTGILLRRRRDVAHGAARRRGFDAVVLPFGTEQGTHTSAAFALLAGVACCAQGRGDCCPGKAMGITPPAGFARRFRENRRRVMGGWARDGASGSGRDHSRSLPLHRCESAARGVACAAGWAAWQWTRDGERVASINLRADDDHLHLSYRVRTGGGRVAGRVRDRQHSPRAVPLRRDAALCHLPRCGERDRLRPMRRQTVRAGALFPMPPLLPALARQPERRRWGQGAAARG